MGNEKQVKNLKKALDLEILIANTSEKLLKLSNERFDNAPNPPTRNVIERNMPQIESKVKFNWVIALIPTLLFWPWPLIYYFAIYKPQCKQDIEKTKNSAEYKQQCANVDAKYDQMQKEQDELYQRLINEYENEVLKKYKQELDAWTIRHNEVISCTDTVLKNAQVELNSLYAETKIIPIQYRTIPALQYIYDMISTSDYEICQAIDSFDKSEQRKLDIARLEEQQQSNQLAYEQNALLDQQNDIANKARRDANIASAVNVAQLHKTNKTLNNLRK